MKKRTSVIATLSFAVLLFVTCQKESDIKATSADISASEENLVQAKMQVFAKGLNNPRGLEFGPDGYLYVAEAGKGGKDSTIGICEQVPFPVGPYHGSPTGGRISRISSTGERTVMVHNLPSSNANPAIGGDIEGVADIAFIGHRMFALVAGAGCSHGVQSMDNGVVRVKEDGSWKMIANTSAFQQAHPVAHPEEDDFEPDGTPYNMIDVDGNLYVLEANHGELMKITPDGAITRVADISASQGHIVPTCLAYWDGNFYVGNLNTFPIVDGSSNIYKITPEGKVTVWAKGFTTVLGIVFDRRGRLYVLENTTKNMFPTPGTGKIIRVDRSQPLGERRDVLAWGLNLPTGIAWGPDKKLYVSAWGFGPAAIGGGQVLKIDITNE